MRRDLEIMPMVDYPIVPPRSATVSTIVLADGTEVIDPEVIPPDVVSPPPAAPVARDTAKLFLLWGSAGVILGAAFTMGVTALSFRSYKRTGSAVGPALWAGGGAVVTGFLLLLAMRKAMTAPSPRTAQWLALATGANAAT